MSRSFEQALEEAVRRWQNLPEVTIIAQGEEDGRDCILVHITCKRAELSQSIDDEIDGHPVRVLEDTEEIVPHA